MNSWGNKHQLVAKFTESFDKEFTRKKEIFQPFYNKKSKIDRIERAYYEFTELLQERNEAEILVKFVTIQKFWNESKIVLNDIKKEIGVNKRLFYIDPNLKPLKINTEKVLKLISHFKVDCKRKESPSKSPEKLINNSMDPLTKTFNKNGNKLRESTHK